ncbi:MAG: crossover junction endodeoxyribonuclease RuvC [Candidatus Nomurabacteria bacterium]|nr:crossover junction endodeoxyribonuclease RuvC [Candidatus Nomurabacteria bacterium]
MSSVRILGIDPGYDRLGVCVLDTEQGKETLVFSTCITTSKKESFEERLLKAGDELENIIKEYSPNEVSIEKIFFTRSKTTAMHVAQIRGVCIYLTQKHKLLMAEYSPPEIKLSVAGHGGASKDDVSFMVSRILKLDQTKNKTLDDEMDAIAIALTHSSHRKMKGWK